METMEWPLDSTPVRVSIVNQVHFSLIRLDLNLAADELVVWPGWTLPFKIRPVSYFRC